MRWAAAIKWYEMGRLSQAKAAEVVAYPEVSSWPRWRATASHPSNTMPMRL